MREALEQRDTFLGIASHELRTPLTILKMNTQLTTRRLRRQGLDDLRLSTRMEGAIQRMERLVNDLLDVSHIQAGQLPLRPSRCELAALCRRAVEDHRAASGRRIMLGAPVKPVLVEVDESRIEQVLDNLLSNALKYSPERSPVAVRVWAEQGEARVRVSDEGVGIAPAVLPYVFDLFHRAPGVHVQTGSAVGLDLGLYITREIVRSHGGRIWVESAERGCAIVFAVPSAAPSRAPEDSNRPPDVPTCQP
jgi:two-component system CheB/CheR fusion protein